MDGQVVLKRKQSTDKHVDQSKISEIISFLNGKQKQDLVKYFFFLFLESFNIFTLNFSTFGQRQCQLRKLLHFSHILLDFFFCKYLANFCYILVS